MKTISFKVTEDEARRIRQQAKREHLSLSDFLRRRAASSHCIQAIERTRCPLTGAEILAPSPGEPPFTSAVVKEMLADFP